MTAAARMSGRARNPYTAAKREKPLIGNTTPGAAPRRACATITSADAMHSHSTKVARRHGSSSVRLAATIAARSRFEKPCSGAGARRMGGDRDRHGAECDREEWNEKRGARSEERHSSTT